MVTPSYKPAFVYGGPTMSVSMLCEHLKNEASDNISEIKVYTTTANGAEELPVSSSTEQSIDGVSVRYFKRITGDHSHFSPKLLWYVVKSRNKFDIIHIHSWWNLVAIPVLILLFFTKAKIVLSPRGMLSSYTLKSRSKRFFHSFIGRFLIKRTHIHCTSEKEFKECKEVLGKFNGFIAFNFVKIPPLKNYKISNKTDNEISLIFLSRIHPVKKLELLLTTLSELPESILFKLTIAGDGDIIYINNLKKLINHLGLDNRIIWHGFVSDSEKFEVLLNSDLFILPSQTENFANSVIESLSVGTPVLISDQVGIAEYISLKKLGWIFELTVESLKNTLLTAIANKEERKRIYREAPDQIRKTFTGSHLARQYLEEYKKICSI